LVQSVFVAFIVLFSIVGLWITRLGRFSLPDPVYVSCCIGPEVHALEENSAGFSDRSMIRPIRPIDDQSDLSDLSDQSDR
jgi:hypothetical protein